MRKSSSLKGVFVPPIKTGNLQPTNESSHRMKGLLHEQASQTLKFCPSKESIH